MATIRKTKSVEAILDAFEQSKVAISTSELLERFYHQMNKTTIYRILNRLEDNDQLHSFMGKDGLRWYAKSKECTSSHPLGAHPHFQCKNCGKIECLPVEISIPSVPHYKVDSAELLLIGTCKNCLS